MGVIFSTHFLSIRFKRKSSVVGFTSVVADCTPLTPQKNLRWVLRNAWKTQSRAGLTVKKTSWFQMVNRLKGHCKVTKTQTFLFSGNYVWHCTSFSVFLPNYLNRAHYILYNGPLNVIFIFLSTVQNKDSLFFLCKQCCQSQSSQVIISYGILRIIEVLTGFPKRVKLFPNLILKETLSVHSERRWMWWKASWRKA